MEHYEFVQHPIEDKLKQIFREAQETLFIATPFIKDYGVELILKNTKRIKNLKVLTNLDVGNITGSGFDIEGLLKLWDRFNNMSVVSLGKLHAKIYIADDKVAFLTSANLTRGGLLENYEYGVILKDTLLVNQILTDINRYFDLGNIFDRETLEDINSDVVKIRELQREIEKSLEQKVLIKSLKSKEDDLQTKILRNRIQGRTINSIFAKTIKYLLETKGLLSTRELNPFIQSLYPDICDDTIDRVIDGQHFGKKWKHFVRSAQQYLKKKGTIYLKEGKWHLAKQ